MTQPILSKLPFDALARVRLSIIEDIQKLKDELVAADREMMERLGAKVETSFNGKMSGLTRLEHEGVRLTLEVRKSVKWDQDDLKGISNRLPPDVAARIFDVDLSIPERVFEAMARTDLPLYSTFSKARTVKYSAPSIKEIELPEGKQ